MAKSRTKITRKSSKAKPTKKAGSKKKTTKKKITKQSSGKAGKKKSTRTKSTKSRSAKKSTGKTTPTAARKKPTKKVRATGNRSKKTVKQVVKEQMAEQAPVAKAAKIKSKLDRKQLTHYRDMLLERRLEIIADINGMEDTALRGKDTSNLSKLPLHMADVGSDNYDQDLTLGLMESERKMLNEIDEALDRIADGTFGICQTTGKPINKARLQAKPWAKYCIQAAREMEKRTPRF